MKIRKRNIVPVASICVPHGTEPNDLRGVLLPRRSDMLSGPCIRQRKWHAFCTVEGAASDAAETLL